MVKIRCTGCAVGLALRGISIGHMSMSKCGMDMETFRKELGWRWVPRYVIEMEMALWIIMETVNIGLTTDMLTLVIRAGLDWNLEE